LHFGQLYRTSRKPITPSTLDASFCLPTWRIKSKSDLWNCRLPGGFSDLTFSRGLVY
jgi:hypothetical protein